MATLSSSIGRKYLMGIAGLVWTGFVLGHMAGNLLILAGPEAFNSYGHAIITNKPLLYGTEAALILSILVHAGLGIRLAMENRAAKPVKYKVAPKNQKKARFGSSWMVWQGSFILAFVIYHLLTFKYGPEYTIVHGGVEMRDLHRLVVEVFTQPLFVVGYIVSLILLGIHLSHGFSSVFQSIGFNHPRYTPMLKTAGYVYAFVVAAGFIVQPVYVFLIYRG